MLKLRNESERDTPSASSSHRTGFGDRGNRSQDESAQYDEYVHFDREAWKRRRRTSFSLSAALCSFAALLWWWRTDAAPRQLTASQL